MVRQLVCTTVIAVCLGLASNSSALDASWPLEQAPARLTLSDGTTTADDRAPVEDESSDASTDALHDATSSDPSSEGASSGVVPEPSESPSERAESSSESRPTSALVLDRRRLQELSADAMARGREPWDLDDDELREEGWQFSNRSFRRGSPLAGFAALTVGIPLHGVGHLLVDDSDSMFKLLMSEIAALGVVGVGTLLRDAGDRRDGLWVAGQTLQVMGLSTFLGGWLADVVGSFKGTTVPLPRNSLELGGLAVDVYYTALFSDELSVNSVAVAGLQWTGSRMVLRPRFSFGPSDRYWRGDFSVEYRHPYRSGRYSYVLAWAEAGEELFQNEGWGRDVLAGGIGVSLDLGDLLEHTRGLVWQLRVGVGAQSFFYESERYRRFVGRNVRLFVPVETQVAMNLNRGLNVAIGYRHRPDELVGTLTRQGGVFFQRFTVLPINRLGISLQLEQGSYLRLWVGVRYYLTNPKL